MFDGLIAAIQDMLKGFGLDLDFDFGPIMKVLEELAALLK